MLQWIERCPTIWFSDRWCLHNEMLLCAKLKLLASSHLLSPRSEVKSTSSALLVKLCHFWRLTDPNNGRTLTLTCLTQKSTPACAIANGYVLAGEYFLHETCTRNTVSNLLLFVLPYHLLELSSLLVVTTDHRTDYNQNSNFYISFIVITFIVVYHVSSCSNSYGPTSLQGQKESRRRRSQAAEEKGRRAQGE